MTDTPTAAPPGVIIATSGRAPGATLATALSRAGHRVVWLHDGPPVAPIDGVRVLPARFDSAAALADAFAQARTALGSVNHVVLSALAPGALDTGEVTGMSFANWSANSQGPTKAILFGLQAGLTCMPEGGVFTLVGPNVGLVGSEQLVPLCTALEGQRSLAKSAARQWGSRGIRINWVGVGATAFDPAFAGLPLPQVPELGPPPPALGRAVTLADDVVPLISFLGSPQARALTGHSFNIDGGDWMLP